jgi:hypothetical protein
MSSTNTEIKFVGVVSDLQKGTYEDCLSSRSVKWQFMQSAFQDTAIDACDAALATDSVLLRLRNIMQQCVDELQTLADIKNAAVTDEMKWNNNMSNSLAALQVYALRRHILQPDRFAI